jgi:hypothetical protein
MSSEQEVAYHRTFLSRYYVAQVAADARASGNRRTDDEITAIRNDDPDAFEDARKALAVLLKVPYRAGAMVNQSRGDVGDRYTYIDGSPSDAQVVEYLRPRNPPPQSVNPTTGVAAIPNPLVGVADAYLNGVALLRTTMYSKMDQQFDDYASLWEKAFSTLMAPYYSGYTPAYAFMPIVDDSWQVLGYYGTLQGGQGCGLLVPEGAKQMMKDFMLDGEIKDYLDKQVPMMAWPGKRGHGPAGWESGDFGVSDYTYGVWALPDGSVIGVQVVGNRDGVEDTWQPTDIVMAGKALLDLGKLGLVTIKILGGGAGRWVGQKILQGATAYLAKKALQELAEEFGNEAAERSRGTCCRHSEESGEEERKGFDRRRIGTIGPKQMEPKPLAQPPARRPKSVGGCQEESSGRGSQGHEAILWKGRSDCSAGCGSGGNSLRGRSWLDTETNHQRASFGHRTAVAQGPGRAL